MPFGRGKKYQGSDESTFDMPGSEQDLAKDVGDYAEDVAMAEGEPYYETKEVESAVEKAIEKRKPKRRLGTGEKIYLYIHTGFGTAQLVNQVFNSRIEADQYAEANFPGSKYQTMSESEVADYVAKQQYRQEQKEAIKESAKEVGRKAKKGVVRTAGRFGEGLETGIREVVKQPERTRPRLRREAVRPLGRQVGRYTGGFFEASRDQAARVGMTREQMQPEIQRAWGIETKGPVTGKDLEGKPLITGEKTKYGTPEKALRTPDLRPYREQTFRGPRINIPRGGEVYRSGFRGPQQRPQGRLNFPQQRSRPLNIGPGFRRAPVKFVGLNGPYNKNRPPYYGEQTNEETTVTTTKKYHKKPKKKRGKKK